MRDTEFRHCGNYKIPYWGIECCFIVYENVGSVDQVLLGGFRTSLSVNFWSIGFSRSHSKELICDRGETYTPVVGAYREIFLFLDKPKC